LSVGVVLDCIFYAQLAEIHIVIERGTIFDVASLIAVKGHDVRIEEEYEDTFFDEDFVTLNQKNEFRVRVFFDS